MPELDTGFKSLFKKPDFVKLFTGQVISGLGDWVATFAFIAVVFSRTASTTNVAIILILRLLPPLVAAPIGGVLADRWPRRSIMVVTDIIRAGLIVVVPFVGLWGIYAIAFAHEFMSLFFLPARDVTVPEIAGKKNLEQANGLMLASSYGSIPIAGAIFSALSTAASRYPDALPLSGMISREPTTLAFFLDGITFLVSAAFIYSMRAGRSAQRPQKEESSSWRDLKEGFSIIWRDSAIRSLSYGVIMAMFGGGVLFAVGIAYVQTTLGGSDATFGWLTALWGLGMAIGLAVVQTLVGRRGRPYIFVAAIAASGGLLIAMALLPAIWLAFTLAVPFGMAFAIAIVLALTLAQVAVEDEVRGRMMGGIQMLYRLGLAAGALTIGAVAQSINRISFGITLDGNQFGMLIGGVLIVFGALASSRVLKQERAWFSG